MKYMFRVLALLVIALAPTLSAGQAGYQVVPIQDGGTIRGTVKWHGALPHLLASELNRDPKICDPLGQKHRDLARLLVSPNVGVAHPVGFIRYITRRKSMDLPPSRRI